MRSGFWRNCRVCFRWCRITVWLLVLAAVCSLLWLNRFGVPDFWKVRLVDKLRERGIELSFTRMRLRFEHGIVAENVSIGGELAASPVLTLGEAQLELDFRALLLRRQLQVDGLILRQGKLAWPVSSTNSLHIDHIQTAVRFQTNDTWSLDKFQADFAGAKFNLSGEIAHAPELQNWNVFHGRSSSNFPAWQEQLEKISDMLPRIHFEGVPQLNLGLRGDARDVRTFVVRMALHAAGARTPWFQAQNLQFACRLAAPGGLPAGGDPTWGVWTNLQPFQIEWIASADSWRCEKLNAGTVACAGHWRAPELAITNLQAQLGGGQLDARLNLNVATRKLAFSNVSCFDPQAVEPLLTGKTDQRLADFSWTQPPALQFAGALVLPAWTNSRPDWENQVRPTLRVNGELAFTNATVMGAQIDAAQTHFSYSNLVWRLPDLVVSKSKTRLAIAGHEDDATKNYQWRLRGVLDPEAARPFLKTEEEVHGFNLVQFHEPLALDLEVRGRLYDYDSIVAKGALAATNFTVRAERVDAVNAQVSYSNRVLSFIRPFMRAGQQHAIADSVVLDFNTRLICFSNILSHADPEMVARTIGPKTGRLVEPYHFLKLPTALINGRVPLREMNEGPEMAEVDMRFDVVQGAPFRWLKFETTNIVGNLIWRGQALLLTNAVAAAYGGSAAGYADFDFRVPHEGADYHYEISVTNVNLHLLATGLAGSTNELEGILSGTLVVTNASTEDWRTMGGRGQVKLHDGLLWDIPIFGVISPVLNTISPGLGNSRATEATAKFVITNGVIYSDSLEIRSTMTRLEYVGTIDLHENVNARVTAQLLRDTWVVGPLVSTVLWPVSKLFEYRVTGTLREPQSEPIYVLPRLLLIPLHPLRALEQLMPGGGSAPSAPAPPPTN